MIRDYGNIQKTQVAGLADPRKGGTYSAGEEAGPVKLPSTILRHLS